MTSCFARCGGRSHPYGPSRPTRQGFEHVTETVVLTTHAVDGSEPDSSSARQVLEGVGRLVPAITARAPEIEAARRIPLDLLDDLVGAGCFRRWRPAVTAARDSIWPTGCVFEELSRADASDWTVMIGATAWMDVAELPPATLDALYADGPNVVGRCLQSCRFRPDRRRRLPGERSLGVCQRVRACPLAVRQLHRRRRRPPDADGVVRAVGGRDRGHLERVGMCGTGGHHFSAHDVLVPAERTFPLFQAGSSLDDTVLRIPVPQLRALLVTSVALGIAGSAGRRCSRWPRTRFLCSTAPRSRPTRGSSTGSAVPMPRSVRRER